MNDLLVFVLYSVVLFAVSIAGACLPQFKRLDDRQTHMLITLSAGIFLGLLFFMLLPEAFETAIEHEGRTYENVALAMLLGFLVIAFVDCFIKWRHMHACPCECHEDEHKHSIYSLSSFIGLSVHAACDGLMLAAALLGGQEVGLVALIGMCLHKFVVLFSLSSSLLLTENDRRSRWTYLTAFSLITPVVGLILYAVFNALSVGDITGLPMAFAAGTFMFVTFCNMVPEAFHRKDNEMRSLFILLIGVAIALVSIWLIGIMGGHIHIH